MFAIYVEDTKLREITNDYLIVVIIFYKIDVSYENTNDKHSLTKPEGISMTNVAFRTQMTAEVDVVIQDWVKVKKHCMANGYLCRTVDEFSERLSYDFWKSTPIKQTDGSVFRELEIGKFVEEDGGLSHRLSSQHVDSFGEITLKINKDFDAEKVERIY